VSCPARTCSTTASTSSGSIETSGLSSGFSRKYTGGVREFEVEAKTLRDAAARWRGKAVVIGIDTKDLTFAAKRYMAHYGVNYGIVRDVDGSESNRWGVTGYPETFFVDAAGNVIPPHVNGPIPADRLNAAIRQAIRS